MTRRDIDPQSVPPVRDLTEGEVPYAEVKRAGRTSWFIYIHHGVFVWGPEGGPHYHFGSEASARARAERLLAKYVRHHNLTSRPAIRVEGDGEAYARDRDRRAETAKALAELRDPRAEWEREFAALARPRRSVLDRILRR